MEYNIFLIVVLLCNIIKYSNQENIELYPSNNYKPCLNDNQKLTCKDLITSSSKISIIGDDIHSIHFINSNRLLLPSKFIKCTTGLKKLTVQSKLDILAISDEAFHDCLQLTLLELKAGKESPTNFINLQPVLRKLSLLNEIIINNIPLKNLTQGYLARNEKLKVLSIKSQHLKSISPYVLSHNYRLDKLIFLDIENIEIFLNVFKNWPLNGFKVHDLIFDNCTLKSFPKFHPNLGYNIRSLTLSTNFIHEITTESANSIVNIKNLNLQNTQLYSYALDGLKQLKMLKTLNLNYIFTLTDLPAQIEQLNQLEEITFALFQGHKISIILPPSIKKLNAPNLKHDILINKNFLSKTNSLTYINLNFLYTSDISFLINTVETFSKSLNVLSISDTNLIRLHSWEFMKPLKSLKILYLDNCGIQDIPNDSLMSLSNLNELYLSNNKLTYSSLNKPNWENVIRNLQILDLSKNQLSNLPTCVFYGFHGTIKMSGNPLVSCLIPWLNSSNFTVDHQNKSATNNCNSIEKDNCKPLKTFVYRIDYLVKIGKIYNTLLIYNLSKENIVNYLFDHMTLELQLGNGSLLHMDGGSEIQMTQKESNIQLNNIKISDGGMIKTCIILWRQKIDYKYEINCKVVNMSHLIIDDKNDNKKKGGDLNLGGWPGVLGIICGTILLIFILLIMIICCCRGRLQRKYGPYDDYDVDIYDNRKELKSVDNSTEYSEPKEYSSLDNLKDSHYTYVSEDRLMAPTDQSPPIPNDFEFKTSTLPNRQMNSTWSIYGNSTSITPSNSQRSRRPRQRNSSQQRDSLFRSLGELLDSTADTVSTAIMPRNFERRISKKPSNGSQTAGAGGTVGRIRKKNKLEDRILKRQQTGSSSHIASTGTQQRPPLPPLNMYPSPSEANLMLNQDEETSPRQRLSLPPVPRSQFKSEPMLAHLSTQLSNSSSSNEPANAPPKPSISQLRYKELLASVDQHLAQLSMTNTTKDNESVIETTIV